MKRIGVRQLKNEATRIVREVREERAEYIRVVRLCQAWHRAAPDA